MGEASYKVHGRWSPKGTDSIIYSTSDKNRNINSVDRILTRALEVNLNPPAVNLLYDVAGMCRTERKHIFFGCKQVRVLLRIFFIKPNCFKEFYARFYRNDYLPF